MWNRLKRMWGKSSESETERVEPALVVPTPEPEPEPEPEPYDPMIERLEAYDSEKQSGGGDIASRLRELLVEAPTDARVLRRAAALMAEFGDGELAESFDKAARSSSDEPLVALGQAFLGMDDLTLALTFADGAIARAHSSGRRSNGSAVAALALGRLGQHAELLTRLDDDLPMHGSDGPALMTRLRYAISALLLEDWERFNVVRGTLGEAEPWVDEIAERVENFPWMEDEGACQRLLFALYGGLLVDDTEDEAILSAPRLGRCIEALATAVRETLPEGTRPAWIGPRGEVIARWLGSLLPENAAIPLSARLPKQPVIVVLADDAELAQLVEMGLSPEASAFPLFQVAKDPGEIGSPMADVIGVFRTGVRLPLELLDVEKAADRLTPRMLAGKLHDEARAARREVIMVAAERLEVRPEPVKGQGTLFEVLEEGEVQDTDEGTPALEAVEPEPEPEPEVELEPVEFFLEVSRERREFLSWTRPVSLEERLTLDPASL